jgi:hypothetical protein
VTSKDAIKYENQLVAGFLKKEKKPLTSVYQFSQRCRFTDQLEMETRKGLVS